ncbi:MAG: hypothetical protein RLZZ324_1330 [Candidatus Parcubacteria bacterium]|jgi:hypothetical protein
MRKPIDAFAPISSEPQGFALLSATMLLGILMAFSFIALDTSLNSRRIGNAFTQSLSAEEIAEAGVHKAVYCVKASVGTYCGGSFGNAYAGESNVSFGGGTFTVAVSGTSTTKTVLSTGTSATGQTKKVAETITTNADSVSMPGFDYAVQAGSLGVSMSNNACTKNAAVRSDADVICGNNATMNGQDVIVTTAGGKIQNCTGIRDGYADKILSDTLTRDAWYKVDPTDIAGSTVGRTKHANSSTPSPLPFPTFDTATWESVASAGGTYNGDYNLLNNATASIGPLKINGNLTLNNNVTLTLTGPIWVNGNITAGNNATIKLSPTFGVASGLLLADKAADIAASGKIDFGNNTTLMGSGTDGSYLLVVTTNTSSGSTGATSAIHVSNNAGSAIYLAPSGSVYIDNNAGAVSVSAKKVTLDNNACVTYDKTGVTPNTMTVGTNSGGGTWHLQTASWREFK